MFHSPIYTWPYNWIREKNLRKNIKDKKLVFLLRRCFAGDNLKKKKGGVTKQLLKTMREFINRLSIKLTYRNQYPLCTPITSIIRDHAKKTQNI